MVICIIALVTFSILGIFSAKYRSLSKEAFDCVFRMVTLRPCTTQLDQRIKSKIVSKLMGRFPTAAKLLYKYFGTLSWIFVITFFATMFYSFYGIYNLVVYGTCDPSSQSCIINQVISCGLENLIVYVTLTILTIVLIYLLYKYFVKKER